MCTGFVTKHLFDIDDAALASAQAELGASTKNHMEKEPFAVLRCAKEIGSHVHSLALVNSNIMRARVG